MGIHTGSNKYQAYCDKQRFLYVLPYLLAGDKIHDLNFGQVPR